MPPESAASPNETSSFQWPASPVSFALLVAILAVLVRTYAPAGDPFEVYFRNYLRTQGEGRGHRIPARMYQLGQRAGAGIAGILDDPSASAAERVAAARLAGYTRDTSLEERLGKLAAPQEDPFVRIAALESLGRLGGHLARSVLDSALQDPDARIRSAALGAVQRGGDRGLAPVLERHAREGMPEEKLAAIEALGRLGGPPSRRALWNLYGSQPNLPEILAVKRALLALETPLSREVETLEPGAERYLPARQAFANTRLRRRLETKLRTLLTYWVEDRYQSEEESCDSDGTCQGRLRYYRDLVRRKTSLRLEPEAFFAVGPSENGKVPREPVLFVRTTWLIRNQVRFQSLSLVRMIGSDPAVFPVRELGFDTFAAPNGASTEEEHPKDFLGEVLRVRGNLSSHDLEVDVALPLREGLRVETYRFEGGVFVPAEKS
ncbi:MAG: HEAT repeat domain-containing protein [Bdellovibrionota bacterium]